MEEIDCFATELAQGTHRQDVVCKSSLHQVSVFFYNCIIILITRWVKMYAFWVKMYALICVTLLSKLYG